MPRILSFRMMVYLWILLVLDLSLAPLFRLGALQPILLYLAILHAGFQWGSEKTVPVAVAVGLLRDLAGSHVFGLETGVLVCAALLLDLLVQKVDRQSFAVRMGVTFLFVFSVTTLLWMFSRFLGSTLSVSWDTFGTSLGTAGYGAVLAPVFFYLTARWFHDRAPLKQYELFR